MGSALAIADSPILDEEPCPHPIGISPGRGSQGDVIRRSETTDPCQGFAENAAFGRHLLPIIHVLPGTAAAATEERTTRNDAALSPFQEFADAAAGEALSTFRHANPCPVSGSREGDKNGQAVRQPRHSIASRRQAFDANFHVAIWTRPGRGIRPEAESRRPPSPSARIARGYDEFLFPEVMAGAGNSSMGTEFERSTIRPQISSACPYFSAMAASTLRRNSGSRTIWAR